MSLKNVIRNVLNIRKDRKLPPAGPMPKIGSSIVRDRLRIRLRVPISYEQWEFFSQNGWRVVDMRTDRRRYLSVPDKVLAKLLERSGEERDSFHARLIELEAKKRAASAKTPTGKPPMRDPAVVSRSSVQRSI